MALSANNNMPVGDLPLEPYEPKEIHLPNTAGQRRTFLARATRKANAAKRYAEVMSKIIRKFGEK